MDNYKGVSGVYKITSPSGRVYVGQSQDLYTRFNQYRRGACKRQPLLYNSLNKYGFDNHTIDVILCGTEHLDSIEIQTISECQSNFNKHPDKRGLNLSDGGPTNRGYKYKYTDELRNKRRIQSLSDGGIANFYSQNPEALQGSNNPFYGKSHTMEAKQKMRAYRTGKYGILNGKSKRVINMSSGYVYESAYACSLDTGINYSTLRSKLNGTRHNDTQFFYQN